MWNERRLHLGAGEVGLQSMLQALLGTMSLFCTAMNQLLVLVLAAKSMAAAPIDVSIFDVAFDSVAVGLMGFLGLLCALRVADSILFDIPPNEEDTPLQFSHAKNLCIINLSNTAALKMTHFNHSQLRHFYKAFDLEGQLEPIDENLASPTGDFCNGHPCNYRIHPEEVFLYTLCKVATGMMQVQIVHTYFGGDKNWWTYAYQWMLKYLKERYNHVIVHQGLACFVDDFPQL
jgi:hypothetical protein